MKNKKRFIFFIVLYIIGYLYFCIYGGIINYGMRISDDPVLFIRLLLSDLPVGVVDLSINMYAWIIVSFFLIAFILWQTNLEGQRANRTFLICYGIHLVFTCLSRGIVDWILGDDWISTFLITIIVLTILAGISVGITYLVYKKKGKLNSFDAYSDIMTKEEFERWQKKRGK